MLDYLKIAKIANECEAKRQIICELYRSIGANKNFTDKTREIIYSDIKNIESSIKKLEDKLKKEISY